MKKPAHAKKGRGINRRAFVKLLPAAGAAGLTGPDADHILAVPSDDTAHVQEVHLMLLHTWCIAIDDALGVENASGEFVV